LDNRSQDASPDILREFERAGHLRYLYEPSEDFSHGEWLTTLARQAYQECDADWVIPADGDEFFVPRQGSLKDVLGRLAPEVFAVSIKRHDMVPIIRPMRDSAPMEMTFRKRESLEWVSGFPIIDKVIHRGHADAIVQFGAHAVRGIGVEQTVPSNEVFTLHFPIRSLTQFESKVRNVGEGLSREGLLGGRYASWSSALNGGTLGDVFAEYVFTPERLTEALATGSILEDRRLAEALTQIRRSRTGRLS
jgi:hypothetical protein